MRLAVLTPVGPGHQWAAWRAYSSSCSAWNCDRGPFTDFRHFLFDDTEGYHGRALARNILMERAYKGWSADWVIHLDCNDMIHPYGFQALGQAMEWYPRARGIWGSHSMIVPSNVIGLSSKQGHDHDRPGQEVGHLFSTRFDIQPLYWEHLMIHRMVGTIGTLACLSARECYKLGFLPDIAAGEFYEHTHAFWASNPCWKMRRPLILCDRISSGASAAESDPKSDHMGRLSAALNAVTEIWRARGRLPITYHELESRNSTRFMRRQDLEMDVFIDQDWREKWVYALDEEYREGGTEMCGEPLKPGEVSVHQSFPPPPFFKPVFHPVDLDTILCTIERAYLEQALLYCNHHQHQAAGLLGLTNRQFRYRLAKLRARTE